MQFVKIKLLPSQCGKLSYFKKIENMKSNSTSNLVRPEYSSWVCIIGGGGSQLPFVRRAVELGLNTLVFDQNPHSEARSVANVFVPMSTHDSNAVLQHCIELQGRVAISSCFTNSSHEKALTTAAIINDYFGLPGIRERMLNRTSSKHEMHHILKSVGLRTPVYRALKSLDDLKSFMKINGQVLIKPARGGAGSMGVSVVSEESLELEEKLNVALANSSDCCVLAEKFIEGVEYSVDGYVDGLGCHVLAVSRKHVRKSSDSLVIQKFITGVSDPELLRALCETAKRAVTSLDINDTFFSFDIIGTNSGLYIIDAGLQLDAKIDRLLNFSGMDIYSTPFRAFANNASGVSTQIPPGYELEFLYAESDGVISSLAQSYTNKNHLIEFEKRVGDHVRRPSCVSDVIGWIVRKTDAGSIEFDHENSDLSSLFEVSEEIRHSK